MLFLDFFMRSLLFAPFTEFQKLDLPLYLFLILARPVIDMFAFGAGQFYESIL